jgi:hypothetical protein
MLTSIGSKDQQLHEVTTSQHAVDNFGDPVPQLHISIGTAPDGAEGPTQPFSGYKYLGVYPIGRRPLPKRSHLPA